MFSALRNTLTGKNALFQRTFQKAKDDALQSIAELNKPENLTQVACIQGCRWHVEATYQLLHALFYGIEKQSAVLTDEDLRSLGNANGERLFHLLNIGMIRFPGHTPQKIADVLAMFAITGVPDHMRQAALRVSMALREKDTQGVCDCLWNVVVQALPRLRNDPLASMGANIGFMLIYGVLAGDLQKQMREMMDEANRLQPL